MPITVKETRRSRSHVSSGSPTARREYVAWGSADGDAIEDAVDLVRPLTVNSLPIDSVACDPREEDETVWDVVYSYARSGSTETPATNAEEISFDLGSQTVKVTQALQTVNRYVKAAGKLTDFKGGIGWDGEKFTGADRFIETFSFSITKYVAKATVEQAVYIQNLRSCAFHTNSARFRGFEIGEVIFVGATGSKRSSTDYAVTFKFVVGKNASGLTVGDITQITKASWDYLWVLYEELEDSTSKFITAHPKQCNVERLYDPANFPLLLGVSA